MLTAILAQGLVDSCHVWLACYCLSYCVVLKPLSPVGGLQIANLRCFSEGLDQ